MITIITTTAVVCMCLITAVHISRMHSRRPGAEFGEDGTNFRRPRFLNDVFKEKISIFTPKISYDFFSFRPCFSYFFYLFLIFYIFTVFNVIYDLCTFFLPCSCFRAHPTDTRPTSLNIGGTDAWAVPTSNMGEPFPQS